jgi:hypothetical protein
MAQSNRAVVLERGRLTMRPFEGIRHVPR